MNNDVCEERIGLSGEDPWFAEHRSRYVFGGQVVRGSRVLDLACGSGLGADLLTAPGRLTVGSDLSMEAVRSAKSLGVDGYAVVRSDALRLPFRDGAFDGVTTFETVEHIEHDAAFLRELRRVLRPDGVLVLSTPNALITRPTDGVPRNPFHVREYTPGELQSLLSAEFATVQMLGQRTSRDYGVCPFWDGTVSYPSARDRLASLAWKAIIRLPRAAAERASRTVLRRPLFPTVDDFVFGTAGVERAHVLLAVCRP